MPSNQNVINRYGLLLIITLLGGFIFMSLISFFSAFLGSIIFYILGKSSMCKLTQKYRWNKSLAAVFIIILSFFIILLPISLVATLLYGKVTYVVSHPDAIINSIKSLDASIYSRFHYRILSAKTIDSIPALGGKLVGLVVNTGVNAVTSILMMYFFLYFMLMKTGRMEASIILTMPFPRSKMMVLGHELYAQTMSNAVGVPLIALAQGICGYLAYLLAGVPEAGFWGVLTGLASILPLVGATIIWAPIALYLFASHMIWQGFAVVAICVAILGTIDNVIRFMLAKKMADVHPIITVLGVVMGLKYFGLAGLIFGPLLISYFFILSKMYYLQYQKNPPAVNTRKKAAENIQLFSITNPFNFRRRR